MKATLVILILTAGLAGGCSVQRAPLANVTPTWSYHEQGMALRPARPGAARVTRNTSTTPETLSLGLVPVVD